MGSVLYPFFILAVQLKFIHFNYNETLPSCFKQYITKKVVLKITISHFLVRLRISKLHLSSCLSYNIFWVQQRVLLSRIKKTMKHTNYHLCKGFLLGGNFYICSLYICSYMDGLTSFVSCTILLVTLLLNYHSLCTCIYSSHERTEWVLMQVYQHITWLTSCTSHFVLLQCRNFDSVVIAR